MVTAASMSCGRHIRTARVMAGAISDRTGMGLAQAMTRRLHLRLERNNQLIDKAAPDEAGAALSHGAGMGTDGSAGPAKL